MKKNKPAGVVATAELDETAQEAAQVDAQAEVEEDAAEVEETVRASAAIVPPAASAAQPARSDRPRSAVKPQPQAQPSDRERSAPPVPALSAQEIAALAAGLAQQMVAEKLSGVDRLMNEQHRREIEGDDCQRPA